MIKIVITEGYRWTYFQWFILGFYKLQEEGKIEVYFKLPVGSQLLSLSDNKFILKIADKLRRFYERDTYNMSGYIEFLSEKKRKYFTIDSADAPYLFHSQKLEIVDIYFKMQCPIEINKKGFPLTDEIIIPWLDHDHVDSSIKNLTCRGKRKFCVNFIENRHKIKPLMVGPRALSEKGFSKIALEKGYYNYIKDRTTIKSKRIMCYFGNSAGPMPEKNVSEPDYDWEADIMGYFGDKVNHPNEKRAIVANYLSKMDNCDARIITKDHSDTGIRQCKELIIPLNEFCRFISDFEYNVNVSGYRRSMPNRFIESLMVDTAVFTDKLAVKWYLPFDQDEVIETVEMAYLPEKEVNWIQFEKDLKSLPTPNAQNIENCFNKKWKPEAVAEYIIDTVKNSM